MALRPVRARRFFSPKSIYAIGITSLENSDGQDLRTCYEQELGLRPMSSLNKPSVSPVTRPKTTAARQSNRIRASPLTSLAARKTADRLSSRHPNATLLDFYRGGLGIANTTLLDLDGIGFGVANAALTDGHGLRFNGVGCARGDRHGFGRDVSHVALDVHALFTLSSRLISSLMTFFLLV
jgi:hypothetical protein